MTEKELIEIQIAHLQGQIKEKQKKLEKLEKTKSPVEEAFKRVYSYYPEGCETSVWVAFQKGYEESQKDYKVGKYQETTQEQEVREWDVVRESMNWCKDHPGQNPLDWVKPQTPEQVADGLKEAFREAVKQGVVSSSTKPRTLYDVCMEWWWIEDGDTENCIEDLVSRIEEWLPKEHDTNSYKWNECIRMIKEKLR